MIGQVVHQTGRQQTERLESLGLRQTLACLYQFPCPSHPKGPQGTDLPAPMAGRPLRPNDECRGH